MEPYKKGEGFDNPALTVDKDIDSIEGGGYTKVSYTTKFINLLRLYISLIILIFHVLCVQKVYLFIEGILGIFFGDI